MVHRASVVAVWLVAAGCPGPQPVVMPIPAETSEGDSSEASSGSSDAGESTGGEHGGGASSEDAAASDGTTVGEPVTGSSGEVSSMDDTSGGSDPFCGDGQVDRDEGEECDDGEVISEDCVLCERVRIIFLTSTLLQGGKLNGLTGADAYCRSLALAAKQDDPESPIVDPGNFKALLSSSTESIGDRHFIGEGPYRLVNGLRVSRNFIALFTEPHENPINVDERSQTLHSPVWTGTDVDGEPYPGIDFCGDWTDLKGTANWGSSDAVDSNWIHRDVDLNPDSDCYSELPIYCVEQE